MIENEVSILRNLHHANIIQLIEDYDTSDSLFMVMELVMVSVLRLYNFGFGATSSLSWLFLVFVFHSMFNLFAYI